MAKKQYAFTDDHPPLLSDHGFGFISKIEAICDTVFDSTIEGRTTIYHENLEKSDPGPLGPRREFPEFIPVRFLRTRIWRLVESPSRIASTQEREITVRIQDTHRERSEISKMTEFQVRANAGLALGGFSMGLDLSHTTSESDTREVEDTHEKEFEYRKKVTLESDKMYAFWVGLNRWEVQIPIVKYTYHPGHFEKDANQSRTSKIDGRNLVFEKIVAVYEDSLALK